jgi:hypothetical protein
LIYKGGTVMPNKLSEKELKIIMYYREEAIADYADHGCNDLPDSIFRGWLKEEKADLKEGFKEWYNKNNDWEFCGGEDFSVKDIPNDDLVKYFIHKYNKG